MGQWFGARLKSAWGILDSISGLSNLVAMPQLMIRSASIMFMLVALLLGGCASNRQAIYLPYNPPTGSSPDAPTAVIASITDRRPDGMMGAFLKNGFESFVQESLGAELEAAGILHIASTQNNPAARYTIDVTVNDVSWAVPNHSGMVRTVFWTSFLTGGLGGVAYGSTSTPVFGRAEFALRIIDRESGSVVLAQSFEGLHEEHTAKLKCDTMETRARVMAEAWKLAVAKAIPAAKTALSSAK